MTMQAMPSRAAIERAEPLDMNQTRSARQDLTITIRAVVDGFDTEVCYTGSIEQLLAVTKRLRELGAEPVTASKPAATSPAAAKPKAETVEPIYQPDGTPCCPTHKRSLVEGQYGLYCSAKAKPGEAANPKGYCSLRFAE